MVYRADNALHRHGKTKWLGLAGVIVAVLAAVPASAQITTAANSDASALATSLQGSGVSFTSSVLGGSAATGTFAGGLGGVGIDTGVLLTTGSLGCASASNTSSNCSGVGSSSFLTLGFTASSAELFFNYVFASEEYNEYVGTGFNDLFTLTLTGDNYAGVNLAQVPGGGGVVSINNVNNGINSAFFRDNTGGTLPIGYDGLTTVLTAAATNLVVGSNYFLTFNIADVGDSSFDSAVFIQGGSIGVVTPPIGGVVPEPATWAMMLVGFGMIGASARYRRRHMTAVSA